MGDTHNWEDKLPPRIRERLARIGEISPEDKEKLRNQEILNSVLGQFYKGSLKPEALWQRLKDEGRASLLIETQGKLLDSITLGSSPEEFTLRKDAILGIETLKGEPQVAAIEADLGSMQSLLRKYKEEAQRAYNDVRKQVEKNPQLRVRQVRQGGNNVIVELTVDEAMKQLPQWQDFLKGHETRYNQEFQKLLEGLKQQVKMGDGKAQRKSRL